MKIVRCLILVLLYGANTVVMARAKVSVLPSPAGEHSSASRLFTDDKGRVFLSWVEQAASKKTARLFFASLQGSQWSQAKQIAQGDNWFVNWADFPSIVVAGQQIRAHYLQKSAAGTFDYDVKVAFSSNGGQTFDKVITAHDDGIHAEHGFASLLPMENGHTFVTWLDGRFTKKQPSGIDKAQDGDKSMTLRSAIFTADAHKTAEWELDVRTCECCTTSAAMTEQGPIVVYRDRSEQEIRDIYIVRQVKGEWSKPTPVHSDGWHIAGCPVNGPAVSVWQQHVAVAWYTYTDNLAKVNLALSADNGATFAPIIEVVSGSTIGRVHLASMTSGEWVVSWIAAQAKSAQLMLAKYSQSGQLLDIVTVAETSSSRRSGFPMLSTSGDKVYMSWTDVNSKKVKVAAITW